MLVAGRKGPTAFLLTREWVGMVRLTSLGAVQTARNAVCYGEARRTEPKGRQIIHHAFVVGGISLAFYLAAKAELHLLLQQLLSLS